MATGTPRPIPPCLAQRGMAPRGRRSRALKCATPAAAVGAAALPHPAPQLPLHAALVRIRAPPACPPRSPLYFGKSVAKELSSSRPPGLSSLVNGWTAQWSMPSWSHGLSFLCCAAGSQPASGAVVGWLGGARLPIGPRPAEPLQEGASTGRPLRLAGAGGQGQGRAAGPFRRPGAPGRLPRRPDAAAGHLHAAMGNPLAPSPSSWAAQFPRPLPPRAAAPPLRRSCSGPHLSASGWGLRAVRTLYVTAGERRGSVLHMHRNALACAGWRPLATTLILRTMMLGGDHAAIEQVAPAPPKHATAAGIGKL